MIRGMADTKEVEQGDAQHPSLVELISSAKPKKCPQAAEPTQVDEIKEAKNKEQKPRTQGLHYLEASPSTFNNQDTALVLVLVRRLRIGKRSVNSSPNTQTGKYSLAGSR